jgi:hypothetical protein
MGLGRWGVRRELTPPARRWPPTRGAGGLHRQVIGACQRLFGGRNTSIRVKVDVVGHGLRLVERVTGRLTARAAGAGALSGAWFGLFIGLLVGLFTSGPEWLRLILGGLLIGAFWGAAFGFAAYWMTRGSATSRPSAASLPAATTSPSSRNRRREPASSWERPGSRPTSRRGHAPTRPDVPRPATISLAGMTGTLGSRITEAEAIGAARTMGARSSRSG